MDIGGGETEEFAGGFEAEDRNDSYRVCWRVYYM